MAAVESDAPNTMEQQKILHISQEVVTWIKEQASLAISIELMATDTEGMKMYPNVSEMPKSIKMGIYDSISVPTEPLKTDCNVFNSWVAIRESLIDKKIPEQVVKQALFGKWGFYKNLNPNLGFKKSIPNPIDSAVSKLIEDRVNAGVIKPIAGRIKHIITSHPQTIRIKK